MPRTHQHYDTKDTSANTGARSINKGSSREQACCETQYWWTLECKCDTILNRKAPEKKSCCVLIIETRYSSARCRSLAASPCENTSTVRNTHQKMLQCKLRAGLPRHSVLCLIRRFTSRAKSSRSAQYSSARPPPTSSLTDRSTPLKKDSRHPLPARLQRRACH